MHDDTAPDAPQAPASAGLEVLAAQAVELESGALPAGERPPEPAQVQASNAAELLAALEMARLMVSPMFGWWEAFGDVWSDPTLKRIADGGALVMERHGWTMGEALSQFGPYIALATATLPPVLVTRQAIQAHRAQLARPPAAEPAGRGEGVQP